MPLAGQPETGQTQPNYVDKRMNFMHLLLVNTFAVLVIVAVGIWVIDSSIVALNLRALSRRLVPFHTAFQTLQSFVNNQSLLYLLKVKTKRCNYGSSYCSE